jgi:hypothetical protein
LLPNPATGALETEIKFAISLPLSYSGEVRL